MMEVIPSLMRNASISLLSGAYATGNQTYLEPVETSCFVNVLTYSYNPWQLLGTYISGIIATSVCVFLGFRWVSVNGTEEKSSFSRFIKSLSNQEISQVVSGLKVVGKVRVKADENGCLKPI